MLDPGKWVQHNLLLCSERSPRGRFTVGACDGSQECFSEKDNILMQTPSRLHM